MSSEASRPVASYFIEKRSKKSCQYAKIAIGKEKKRKVAVLRRQRKLFVKYEIAKLKEEEHKKNASSHQEKNVTQE